jgi:hypothetical protein
MAEASTLVNNTNEKKFRDRNMKTVTEEHNLETPDSSKLKWAGRTTFLL